MLDFAMLNQHIVSAATTNATLVATGEIKFSGWDLANTSASWRYVKIHDLAVIPVAGQNVKETIAIPPGGKSTMFWGQAGIEQDNGLAYTITVNPADTDATAVALNDVVGELFYYVFAG